MINDATLFNYIIALCVAINDNDKKTCVQICKALNKLKMDNATIYTLLKPATAKKLYAILNN